MSKKKQHSSQFVSKKCAKYGTNDPKLKEVTDAYWSMSLQELYHHSLLLKTHFSKFVSP
jgi:hypothetical protein